MFRTILDRIKSIHFMNNFTPTTTIYSFFNSYHIYTRFKMVGPAGFEPATYGSLQLQTTHHPFGQ